MHAAWWCPEIGTDGRTVVAFFVTTTDITEQKHNQAALVVAQKMEAGPAHRRRIHDFK